MGALRTQHGHPEPYHVKYWQVGNEIGSADYGERVAAFCAAMKKADPDIKLLSSFPSAAALRNAGDYWDYLCPHHYSPDLAAHENDFQKLRGLIGDLGASHRFISRSRNGTPPRETGERDAPPSGHLIMPWLALAIII